MSKNFVALVAIVSALSGGGCQVLQYTNPNGERLSRAVLGVNTSVSSLVLETGTNGIHRVELRGYASDSSQAMSTVTEAAVRAAVQSAVPR